MDIVFRTFLSNWSLGNDTTVAFRTSHFVRNSNQMNVFLLVVRFGFEISTWQHFECRCWFYECCKRKIMVLIFLIMINSLVLWDFSILQTLLNLVSLGLELTAAVSSVDQRKIDVYCVIDIILLISLMCRLLVPSILSYNEFTWSDNV